MSLQIGIRRQQGRGHTSRIKIPCPKCDGYYLRAVYVKDHPAQAKTEWRRVGLYCDGCRYFEPVEKPVDLEVIEKYPVLEHVVDALNPYMHTVKGLYLHGSRVRGDYREDSDYDLLLITQDKIEKDLKAEMEKYNIQLEYFTLKQANKQLELEPAYLLTVLRQGIPLIGADLQKQLLSKKVNDIALLAEIDECIKRLRYLKIAVRGHKPDDEGKARIFLYTMRRLRRAYYIKQLYDKDMPPLSEEFKSYYKGDFEQIHKLYRIVRDLQLDEKDMNETERTEIPEGIKRMTKSMLKELLSSVYAYVKDADEKLVEIYLETHPE